MKRDTIQLLPLSPASFHILLALAGDELHGYGIMQAIARQSAGKYRLGPGTLYDNLQRMMVKGVIKEADNPPKVYDPRRRYYRLTAFGRRVLSTEVERLEKVLHEARS